MKTRTMISILILTMIGASSIIVPTIIFLRPSPIVENGNNNHNNGTNPPRNYTFMYPDPLFYNGTMGNKYYKYISLKL